MDSLNDVLLIIKVPFVLKKNKRDELLADIKEQIKNHVVILPSFCDFEVVSGDVEVIIKDEKNQKGCDTDDR